MSPPVIWFEELDSTNAEARRRAEAGEAGPVWIAARRQTAGRGRRGRAWSTETGNLAATLLLTTDRSPAEAAQLTFVTALALADLFDAYVPAALVTIKWPNDVMIDRTKTSGILIESGTNAEGRLWMAIGCGVNLSHAPTDAERPATRFADHLKAGCTHPPSPEDALTLLADAFERRMTVWELEGFAPVQAAWTARAQGLGEACVARLGNETVEGAAEGLEADGSLRLRLPSGEVRRITAGDVFFS